MGLRLKNEPTTFVGEVPVVDGGIALKHPRCGGGYTAFTHGELTPLPYELTCAHCDQPVPMVWPEMRKAIEDVLSRGTETHD